ncbi:hypothetical protein M422DRAFT_775350, partial [Sphaerobolus stellatus SS14]
MHPWTIWLADSWSGHSKLSLLSLKHETQPTSLQVQLIIDLCKPAFDGHFRLGELRLIAIPATTFTLTTLCLAVGKFCKVIPRITRHQLHISRLTQLFLWEITYIA